MGHKELLLPRLIPSIELWLRREGVLPACNISQVQSMIAPSHTKDAIGPFRRELDPLANSYQASHLLFSNVNKFQGSPWCSKHYHPKLLSSNSFRLKQWRTPIHFHFDIGDNGIWLKLPNQMHQLLPADNVQITQWVQELCSSAIFWGNRSDRKPQD